MLRKRKFRQGGGKNRSSRDYKGSWNRNVHRKKKVVARNRDSRQVSKSSRTTNSRERISLESGNLLLIDQFMLANDLMLNELEALKDASHEQRENLIRKYGGEVVKLEPGEYRIARDPFKFYMAIYPEKSEFYESELDKSMKPIGEVFVNTRCLVFVDWELLNDFGFLNQYSELWNSGKDKKCRDLIREAGGAVRYGFNRHGDELGVHVFREAGRVYLWPTTESSGADYEYESTQAG